MIKSALISAAILGLSHLGEALASGSKFSDFTAESIAIVCVFMALSFLKDVQSTKTPSPKDLA